MSTVLEHRPSPTQQHSGHRTLQIHHTPTKSSSSPLTAAIPSAMAPWGSRDEGSCFSPGSASECVAAVGWDRLRSVWCPVPPALAAAPPAAGGCRLCWVAPGGSLSSWRRAGAARQPSTWKTNGEVGVHVVRNTGGCLGAGSPSSAPHLAVEGTVMGFCTARATLSPFWKMAS